MKVKELSTRKVTLNANGEYLVCLPDNHSFNTIETSWESESVEPGGMLTFTSDGDPGAVPGQIVLSATGSSGSRTLVINGRLNRVIVTVSGMPEGGSVLVRLNG